MKNNRFYLSALTALVLLFTSCPNPGGGDTTSVSFGDALSITNQQVWIQDFNSGNFSLDDNTKFSGDLSLSDNGLGGSGEIKEGLLNYSIGVPADLGPLALDDIQFFSESGIYTDFSVSPENVLANVLNLSVTGGVDSGSSGYDNAVLLYGKNSVGLDLLNMKITGLIDSVSYIYVDSDAVITAAGSSVLIEGMTVTTGNINLSLKKGWNLIYASVSAVMDLDFPNLSLISEAPDFSDGSIFDFLYLLNGTVEIKFFAAYPSDAKWLLVSTALN